ncbi:hypothetical protein GGS24DRAFT_268889 [Hypoxylon argillaceum]|nr:hypothetical protein GGS24DRAFT_268889 [Hypoxylon argillaceum]
MAQLNPVQHGPPYGTTQAVVGGVPTVATDVPVAAVLLALFVASAAAHMTILQLNKRAGLKFLFSGMLFALCALRSVALGTRIAWAAHPRVANVAIAAGILTQTGSVLVFVINLIFAQRVLRAYHARIGWHAAVTLAFRFLVACVVASLLMVIAVTIQSFFTLDPAVRRADRTVQLFAGTYMAALAFLPIPIVALAALLPRTRHVEKFGAGRWRSKLRLLLFTAALATLGATFRVFTGYVPRPLSSPAWYHSRACYYCFNFVTDLTISAAYLFSRFDRRFIVPNGAKGPGDYGRNVRVRPQSIVSSTAGGEEEEGNETDPEKLAKLRDTGNEDGSEEKASLPLYDEKGKGVDKGKGIALGDDEKEPSSSVPVRSIDAQTQTYGPGGDWLGVPWPFRTSWAMTRTCGPMPSPANQSSAGDSTDTVSPLSPSLNPSPLDDPPQLHSCIDEVSSQWGGETSSTYIQEPEPAHVRTQRYFYPPHSQTHVFGQALTADEEIHLGAPGVADDAMIWPFTSETFTSGRDPITRSQSAATRSHASCSRSPGKRPISRSQSSRTAEHYNVEGGWI